MVSCKLIHGNKRNQCDVTRKPTATVNMETECNSLNGMTCRETREIQIRRQIIELRINMNAVPDRNGSEGRARNDLKIAGKKGK